MKINFKKLFICILIPVALGFLVGLITPTNYQDLIKPSFAPPSIVFPIVWTILYILMGISSYIILESNSDKKDRAIKIYIVQLMINLLWSFLFFTFHLYYFSFCWIILLLFFVITMIYEFIQINKLAGYLQIPYWLWLIFAGILNLSIALLN